MRKENIKLSVIISLIVVISLSATYAYMELSTSGNSATGQGGCFEVNYEATAINTSALQSTTNDNYAQGANSVITLSKNEDCEIYTKAEIYLHTNTADTTAPLCYDEDSENYLESSCSMKYKIMQGTEEISTGEIMAETPDQLLATVDLTENATSYTVYLWINSETSKGTYNGTTYSGYLYASSTQTSTVTGS